MDARCLALVRTDLHGGVGVRGPAARAAGAVGADASLPAGYGPPDLDAAYNLPVGLGLHASTPALADLSYATCAPMRARVSAGVPGRRARG